MAQHRRAAGGRRGRTLATEDVSAHVRRTRLPTRPPRGRPGRRRTARPRPRAGPAALTLCERAVGADDALPRNPGSSQAASTAPAKRGAPGGGRRRWRPGPAGSSGPRSRTRRGRGERRGVTPPSLNPMESTQSIYPTLRYADARRRNRFPRGGVRLRGEGGPPRRRHRRPRGLSFGGSLIMLGDNAEGDFAKIAPRPAAAPTTSSSRTPTPPMSVRSQRRRDRHSARRPGLRLPRLHRPRPRGQPLVVRHLQADGLPVGGRELTTRSVQAATGG